MLTSRNGLRASQRISAFSRQGPSRVAVLAKASAAAEPMPRRQVLSLGLLALVASQKPAQAEEAVQAASAPSPVSSITRYEDTIDKFGLSIPSDWVQAEGSIAGSLGSFSGPTGARRTVAFFPPGTPASEVSVSVVVTNVSFEFTKLGSFGNISSFANNLVNSLDRSYLLRAPQWVKKPDGPIQVASLVDYSESNGQYFVEYTVQKMPEPQRHLLSRLALGSNGMYNRLYTLTAQCPEDDLPKYRAILQAAVDSFEAHVKPLYG